MSAATPKVGDVAAICSMLLEAMATYGWRIERGERHATLIIGDDRRLRDATAAWRAHWDATRTDLQARNRDLCRQQLNGFREFGNDGGIGWDYTLSTNIYGWACGSQYRSNVMGGRYASTPRGATLEDCYRYGLARVAEGRNQTLRLSLRSEELTDEILAGIGLDREGNGQ